MDMSKGIINNTNNSTFTKGTIFQIEILYTQIS